MKTRRHKGTKRARWHEFFAPKAERRQDEQDSELQDRAGWYPKFDCFSYIFSRNKVSLSTYVKALFKAWPENFAVLANSKVHFVQSLTHYSVYLACAPFYVQKPYVRCPLCAFVPSCLCVELVLTSQDLWVIAEFARVRARARILISNSKHTA